MSVACFESGSRGNYKPNVSGGPSGCALRNSLNLMLVFSCTPLILSKNRHSTLRFIVLQFNTAQNGIGSCEGLNRPFTPSFCTGK